MAGETLKYDAFISYSPALDGTLAEALQTGLEQFAKPWYRRRSMRIFRDSSSLAANPGLWPSIEAALASSAWLVLMASPDVARSPWVNREVAWWLANKSPQRMLVVLTEGEFAWDDAAGDGDGATAALPPALRGAFVEEPRWVDLRWLHDVDQADQSNPRLRGVVADVAATVREVPKDALVAEHIYEHRRTVRLAQGGVTLLTMLTIATLAAVAVAVKQRNHVQEQARIVTDELMISTWGVVAICLASAAAGAVLSLLLSAWIRGRRKTTRVERPDTNEDQLLNVWPKFQASWDEIGVRNRSNRRTNRGDVDLSDSSTLSVTIYLSDESVHEQVEVAVEDLLVSVGGHIVYRDDPEFGSWFRRMWVRMNKAAHSPLAHEATIVTVHAMESRLVLTQDATVTATMLQNLGPVLAALQPTKDAVIRAGALLIVKTDWVVAVHQLTSSQQLRLDHQPQLAQSPHDILAALGPRAGISTQSPEELKDRDERNRQEWGGQEHEIAMAELEESLDAEVVANDADEPGYHVYEHVPDDERAGTGPRAENSCEDHGDWSPQEIQPPGGPITGGLGPYLEGKTSGEGSRTEVSPSDHDGDRT